MLPVGLAIALLAAASQSDLTAAAASSGRPVECAMTGGGRSQGRSVWERTVAPDRVAYCAALARADARIEFAPAQSREAAEIARELGPTKAAPLVALGRAAVRLSDFPAAHRLFAQARARDPRSLDHPDALHGYATALRLTGHLEEALGAYRVLVPRLELVPRRAWRARVMLEAAHTCMALAGQGPNLELLDEAHSYLRSALEDPHQPMRLDLALSLALILDRMGRAAQADALLRELRRAERWPAARSRIYLTRPADESALHALALETVDPDAASAQWRQLLGSANEPEVWLAPARARLARLQARMAPRPARRAR